MRINDAGNPVAILASTVISNGKYSFNLTSLGITFSSTLVVQVRNQATGAKMRAFVASETVNIDPVSEAAVRMVLERVAVTPGRTLDAFTVKELSDLAASVDLLTTARHASADIDLEHTVASIKNAAAGDAVISAFIGAASGAGQTIEGPGDVGNYFPNAVGNMWQVQVTTWEPVKGWVTYTDTLEITETREVNGVPVTVFRQSNPSNSGIPEEDYRSKDSAGIVYHGNSDPSDTLTSQVVPYREETFPLQAGATFGQINGEGVDCGEDLDGDGIHETCSMQFVDTVTGFETVTLPMGTFRNCAKIETRGSIIVTSSRYGTTATETVWDVTWRAPGIGQVRASTVIAVAGTSVRTTNSYLTGYTIDGHSSTEPVPSIVSQYPAADVTITSPRPTITATFSEAMDPTTIEGNSFLVRDSTGAYVAGSIAYADRIASFTPNEQLDWSGTYTFILTTDMKNTAGNAMADSYTWSFSIDAVPPSISSAGPTNAVQGNLTSISAVFAEEMNPSTINGFTFTVKDADNYSFSPRMISYANRIATLTTWYPLPSGSYTATISTGAQDVAGNALADTYSWTFTVDRPGPAVVSTSPTNNATGVDFSPTVTVTFSEDMDPSSLWFSLREDGGALTSYTSYSNKTAKLVPSRPLTRGKTYTAFISQLAQDLAGNVLGKDYSWSFTVDPGLFLPPVSFAAGSFPQGVAIGDINGDGRNDVVVATYYLNPDKIYQVFVYLQNAEGNLEVQTPIEYTPSNNYAWYQSVAIGDLNHDGRNDIVVANAPTDIAVFLQNASGGFDPARAYPTTDSSRIRIADLNNDGLMDIAGLGGLNTMSIWYQNEGGGLNSPIVYAVQSGGGSADIAIGDVNNDGLVDIVVKNGDSAKDIAFGILTQRQDGTLNEPVYYDTQSSLWDKTGVAIAIGDLNGDGLNDIVMTYGTASDTPKIGVFVQNLQGGFNPPVEYDLYHGSASVYIEDVNGDGINDVIVRHADVLGIYCGIYYGQADGTLTAEDLYAYGVPTGGDVRLGSTAVGDINGDGLADIAILDSPGFLKVLYHVPPP
jgi:hypothetical protein